MKDQKKGTNFIVTKRNLRKEGYFFQSSFKTIYNTNLKDAEKLLLIGLITCTDQKLSLKYYQEKFKWSKGKMASTVKKLEDKGFLKVKKYGLGYGCGFDYRFIISEFGNLKPEPDENIIKNEGVEDFKLSDKDFGEFLKNYRNLLNLDGFDKAILNSDFNVKKFVEEVNILLRKFYSKEIRKIQDPNSNPKAFKELQKWLKKELFENHNANLYNDLNQNIEIKYLKLKSIFPLKSKIDYETELQERTYD
ncbi:MAG: hypothetical protein ABNG98_10185 [Flavobacterium sp.]|jgi:hypothetical protein